MNKIKIGILGVGSMGRNHLRLCAELPEFELVGYSDPSAGAAHYAEQYGIRRFEDAGTLLDAVDAVSIAAPSSLHLELALQAAAAGRHALVEKPLALSAADANTIVDAFEKADCVLAVGHVERFNPVVVELAKVLGGEEIIGIDVRRCSPWNGRIIDADVVQDLMIHDLDLVANVLWPRPVREVLAAGSVVVSPDMADFAQVLLKFDGGVLANITASRVTEDKIREITVHTRQSLVRADLLNRTLTLTRQTKYDGLADSGHTYRQENITARMFVAQVEPLRAELQHFARMANGQPGDVATGPQAAAALELQDRIEKVLGA